MGIRLSATTVLVLLSGCSEQSVIRSIRSDPQVKAALDAMQAIFDADRPLVGAPDRFPVASCVYLQAFSNKLDDIWVINENAGVKYDPSANWVFDDATCMFAASSQADLVGDRCSGSFRLSQDGDARHYKLGAQGQITTGAGTGWSFKTGTPEDPTGMVLLNNHTTGAGCTTDVSNFIYFSRHSSTNAWAQCTLTVVRNRSGSCIQPDWALSASYVTRN